ncbi:MAG: hypothetical protein ACRDP6_47205 [Actinoallomurus sp.]
MIDAFDRAARIKTAKAALAEAEESRVARDYDNATLVEQRAALTYHVRSLLELVEEADR